MLVRSLCMVRLLVCPAVLVRLVSLVACLMRVGHRPRPERVSEPRYTPASPARCVVSDRVSVVTVHRLDAVEAQAPKWSGQRDRRGGGRILCSVHGEQATLTYGGSGRRVEAAEVLAALPVRLLSRCKMSEWEWQWNECMDVQCW